MQKPLELELERTRLHSVNFQQKDNIDQGNLPDKVSLAVNLEWRSHYDRKRRQLYVLLFSSIDQDDISFTLEAAYEGRFRLSKKPKKDELERLQNINCPAILFPFLRESIAEVTRRGDLEPINLPILNFVHLWQEKKATQAHGEKGIHNGVCLELGDKQQKS